MLENQVTGDQWKEAKGNFQVELETEDEKLRRK